MLSIMAINRKLYQPEVSYKPQDLSHDPGNCEPTMSPPLLRALGAVYVTFSLSSIKPSRGRDIDHWFLQSSKMMMFSTVESIWNRKSEVVT